MNKLIEKPHLIFLLVIPIIMLIGFLSGESTYVFNFEDTYYVIAYRHLTTLISMLFGLIGIGYWIMQKANRKLSRWMNMAHVGLTFGGAFIMLILAQFYRESIMEFEYNDNLTLIITLILLFVILGQLIFPINIISGLIKKRNKTSG